MANYSFIKLTFMKLCILSTLHTYFYANALRCYVCRPDGSESDQRLRDVFNAINQQSEGGNNRGRISTCSSYKNEGDIPLQQCRSETAETRCVKFSKLKSGSRGDYDFVDENDFSARGCANIDKPYASFLATEGWGRHEQYNDVTLHYCNDDACNSSLGLGAGPLLLIGFIFLLAGGQYLL